MSNSTSDSEAGSQARAVPPIKFASSRQDVLRMLPTDNDRQQMTAFFTDFVKTEEKTHAELKEAQERMKNTVAGILEAKGSVLEDKQEIKRRVRNCTEAWDITRNMVLKSQGRCMEQADTPAERAECQAAAEAELTPLREYVELNFKKIYHVNTDLSQEDQQKYKRAFDDYDKAWDTFAKVFKERLLDLVRVHFKDCNVFQIALSADTIKFFLDTDGSISIISLPFTFTGHLPDPWVAPDASLHTYVVRNVLWSWIYHKVSFSP